MHYATLIYVNIAAALKDVDSIVDSQGLPVDEEIKFAIAALMVAGIPTSASCAGHLDSGDPFPWVRIGQPAELPGKDSYIEPEIQQIATGLKAVASGTKNIEIYVVIRLVDKDARYHIAVENDSTDIKSLDDMSLDDAQIRDNYHQRAVVMELLQDFYKTRRDVSFDRMLIIEAGGSDGDCVLQPMGGAIMSTIDEKIRSKKLVAYRKEFKDFGEYLVLMQK